MFKVVDIGNTSIYLNTYNNSTFRTEIPLDEKTFLIISFNKYSTVYNYCNDVVEIKKEDEEFDIKGGKKLVSITTITTYISTKNPLSPHYGSMWYVGEYGKYGSGVGELKEKEEKT